MLLCTGKKKVLTDFCGFRSCTQLRVEITVEIYYFPLEKCMLSIPSPLPMCCPCVTFVHCGVGRGTASVGFKTQESCCFPPSHRAKNCRILVVFGFKCVLELCHQAFPYLAFLTTAFASWKLSWFSVLWLFFFFISPVY